MSFLVTRPPSCWKPDSCFWFVRKNKEDKSEFVTKSVGIIVRLFSSKNFSQIPSKTFATQCFFTDHLNHKTVNKTTCRTSPANPCQLWTGVIIFWGFQDFLIYLAMYFSLILNSILITEQCFARAMQIKQFNFF